MRSGSWGWRARFGILVIDKDPVAEAEFWALAPAGVTVHAARFASPRTPGTDDYSKAAQLVAESPELHRGLDFLGQMRLDAICVCFVTSSFLAGPAFDDTFTERAGETAHGVPVTTTARSIGHALAAAGVRRPYVVVPPWFKDEILAAAQAYFTELGAPPDRVDRFDPGAGWRHLEPWQVWDAGGQFDIRPEDVYRQIRRNKPADADGVVIAGSGFRAIEVIEPLRADLGVPVLTSNQTGIWECLRLAGMHASLD
jgi:maleate cis-trans isomerase